MLDVSRPAIMSSILLKETEITARNVRDLEKMPIKRVKEHLR